MQKHITAIKLNLELGNVKAAHLLALQFAEAYQTTPKQRLWFGRISQALDALRLAIG